MKIEKNYTLNGMTNIDDVIHMIKDNIDRGDIEDARLPDQLNDYNRAKKKRKYIFMAQVELDIERDYKDEKESNGF